MLALMNDNKGFRRIVVAALLEAGADPNLVSVREGGGGASINMTNMKSVSLSACSVSFRTHIFQTQQYIQYMIL